MPPDSEKHRMDNKIPVRLKKEPLLEAIWEVRFSGAKSSVADLLPGMLFKALSDKYKNIVRLPAASIPGPILEQDPGLRYAPKIKLENGNQAVLIGEHVVSLSCRRPYSGWARFAQDIDALAKAVQGTNLINTIERFSLKYIDLIELDPSIGLNCLNLDLKLGNHEINTKPVQIRTEIKEDNLIHIVQIISPADVQLPGSGKLTGVLVDIDTIMALSGGNTWVTLKNQLDGVHLACKKMFFSLMKRETIERLEPVYER